MTNMQNKKLKIVFFGTPEFASTTLEALMENGYDVAAVVTMPDKYAGRGHKLISSAVKITAEKYNLPILQPEKLKDPVFLSQLQQIGADLFVVIAFRMLPREVWSMPPKGTFNLHASLLPKYRGAAPINRAIMNGETKTGVTTFLLKHEIDTGDILLQKEADILPEDNVGTLYDKLMNIGKYAVMETLEMISSGNVCPMPQSDQAACPAPKIFAETCQIDWSDTALNIHNQVRGLSPYPGARATALSCEGKEQELKIFKTEIVAPADKECFSESPIGSVIIHKKHLYVYTGDGIIEVKELQPSGKRRMMAEDYLLGYQPMKML